MSARSLNRAQLIGNLTRDVELRYTSGGTAVGSFSVATNRTYTDSTGKVVESVEFTNVVAWAKLGEICAQLLRKGSKVYIDGRLHTSTWTDNETGKNMRRTEVVATDMILLSGGSTQDSREASGSDSSSSSSSSSSPSSSSSSSAEDSEKLDVDEDFKVDFEEITSNDKDKKSDDDSDSKKKEDDSETTPF